MAIGFVGAALSPNVWVAAACCLVAGVGNGAAVACNALLVQRGTFDRDARPGAHVRDERRRIVLVGVGNGVGGCSLDRIEPALDLGSVRRGAAGGRGRRQAARPQPHGRGARGGRGGVRGQAACGSRPLDRAGRRTALFARRERDCANGRARSPVGFVLRAHWGCEGSSRGLVASGPRSSGSQRVKRELRELESARCRPPRLDA